MGLASFGLLEEARVWPAPGALPAAVAWPQAVDLKGLFIINYRRFFFKYVLFLNTPGAKLGLFNKSRALIS